MKVKELIEELQACNPEAEVEVNSKNSGMNMDIISIESPGPNIVEIIFE